MSAHSCVSSWMALLLLLIASRQRGDVVCCYSWTDHFKPPPKCMNLIRSWTDWDILYFFFFLGFSILQPWWTWGRSSTSTGSCKKPKPITSEHFIWNRMTPSPSPTCASCGTSWRNRAWGPRAPELSPARPPTCHLHARPGGEGGLRGPRSLLSSRRDGRETQGGCLLREAVTVPLLITPELCIHLRPAAFL